MRPLLYSINLTLDGCYDHLAGIPDEELHHFHAGNLARADAVIFGRVTYQMMEEAWRKPAESGVPSDWMEPWMLPFAHTIHATKKYVVSATLESVDWNAELLHGNLAESVKQLKQEPGNGLCVAGVKLALALTELELIDQYEFVVHPRIAGHGPTLFAGLSKYVDLKLVSQQQLGTGSVALRYELKR